MGFHHLTVRDWKFSVHFTLHRFKETVGKGTIRCHFLSVTDSLSLAFFTSEAIDNERVSPRRRCLMELVTSLGSSRVQSGRHYSFQRVFSVSTVNIASPCRGQGRWLSEFYMRVWITSGDVCRLFLTYDIALDEFLVPDVQVS